MEMNEEMTMVRIDVVRRTMTATIGSARECLTYHAYVCLSVCICLCLCKDEF